MAGVNDPYTLTFDPLETELVLQGLGKLPAERSYNLLTRLGQEIARENQRRQAPAVAGGNGALMGGIVGGLDAAAQQEQPAGTPPT